ncbi:MAG: hypothetical protein G8345_01235 [Magnetococcales bacterium]|nr:hypothetical protein [Magnetococcales bacterium]
MLEAWRWFFRSFGPYVVGISVGVIFAYLLTLFASGTKVPTSYEQWLALAREASDAVHRLNEVPASKETGKPQETPAVKPVAAAKAEPAKAAPAKVEPPVPAKAEPPVPAKAEPPVPAKTAVAIPAKPEVAKVEPPKPEPAKIAPAPALAPAPAPVVIKETPMAAPAPAPVAPAPPAEKKSVVVAAAPAPAPAPAPEKKETSKESSSSDNVLSCGAPPRQPGAEMNQYMACRWKENCLNRLAQARYMIEQGKLRCPTVGYDAQACQAYYQSLEDRYQPSMCEH